MGILPGLRTDQIKATESQLRKLPMKLDLTLASLEEFPDAIPANQSSIHITKI